MSLNVALQMDPIEHVSITGDSTFRIGLEAQSRGHRLFQYTPDRLSYREGRLIAVGRSVTLRREQGNHVSFGDWEERDLASFDVVWLRQDPPFDMGYITNTHLLERVHPETLVVNDPFWVRNCPEKLLVLDFPDLTPATLITRDIAQIRDFRQRHGDIIVKPLYGNGGAGVFHLRPDDPNLSSLLETFLGFSNEPVIVQKYLPAVVKGDKRIILVDGEPVGAINRVPAQGEARSNMHVGGRAEKIGLTEREREICARLAPTLKEKGLLFTGIDVIDGWLTEINVTSPTGIQELERFDGTNAAELIWQAIETRRGQRS
ncbi:MULTISPECIES: glutathione synthase [unclassified Paracoccus (in: a-proteobacteria)]|uniref:glutathione synthase n=1 Tax=unclassified Paracoccus (in: a-proteobacteria) TaxID=2688777 RepID=UPI0012B35956|nr:MULTISPECIES: glutathione synthase [unclassified Paracoccus (in: a-proteobacteria)]UXU74083.1 glutathione synthase [Paracoccus sp. SMMA_5]UXU79973.1 glutathione synthase [Paracoccus sp. SMMA_5_TC]